MITKEQAMKADRFHVNGCRRDIGARGGIKEKTEEWRRNGQTKTWKRNLSRFAVPVKYGLYNYGCVEHEDNVEGFPPIGNASHFHVSGDCPLNDPRFATSDARKTAGDGEYIICECTNQNSQGWVVVRGIACTYHETATK